MIKIDKDVKLEDALDRLEEIIEKLQDSNLSLDLSLKVFEEGVGLIRVCQEKLDCAENKITVLLKNNTGKLDEVPFSIEGEE